MKRIDLQTDTEKNKKRSSGSSIDLRYIIFIIYYSAVFIYFWKMVINNQKWYNLSKKEIWLLKWVLAQPKFTNWIDILQEGVKIDLTDLLEKAIKKWTLTNKEIVDIRSSSLLENLAAYKNVRESKNDIVSVLLINEIEEMISSLPTAVLPWLTKIQSTESQQRNIDININTPAFLQSLEENGRVFSDAINFGEWLGEWLVLLSFQKAFGTNTLLQVKKKINSLDIKWVLLWDKQEYIPRKTIIDALYLKSGRSRPKKSIKETMQFVPVTPNDQLVGEIMSLGGFIKQQNFRPEDIHENMELLGRFFKSDNWYDIYTIGTYSDEPNHFLNVFIKQKAWVNPVTWTINKLCITQIVNYPKPKNPLYPLSINAEII
jgi:hypothetical protein